MIGFDGALVPQFENEIKSAHLAATISFNSDENFYDLYKMGYRFAIQQIDPRLGSLRV